MGDGSARRWAARRGVATVSCSKGVKCSARGRALPREAGYRPRQVGQLAMLVVTLNAGERVNPLEAPLQGMRAQ